MDVFSPNHIEIARIFRKQNPEVFDRATLEDYAARLLASGIGQSKSGIVTDRAEEAGCLIASPQRPFAWLPPFYEHPTVSQTAAQLGDSDNTPGGNLKSRIVDPIGTGNAFVGAFTIGLLKTGSPVEAAMYGNVGASFALEQIGLPKFETNGEEEVELWNGVEVEARLLEYKQRPDVAMLLL